MCTLGARLALCGTMLGADSIQYGPAASVHHSLRASLTRWLAPTHVPVHATRVHAHVLEYMLHKPDPNVHVSCACAYVHPVCATPRKVREILHGRGVPLRTSLASKCAVIDVCSPCTPPYPACASWQKGCNVGSEALVTLWPRASGRPIPAPPQDQGARMMSSATGRARV